MNWLIIIVDVVLSTLFIAANVIYAVKAVHDVRELKNYNAFNDIWYLSSMNKFGKVVCSIFTGVFCCVGIFVLYAIKFVYWLFHYKRGK